MPTAKLVLYFLKAKPPSYYRTDHVREIWSALKSGGVNQSMLLDIRNAMLALGHDPELPS
jgi:hypothetical protein